MMGKGVKVQRRSQGTFIVVFGNFHMIGLGEQQCDVSPISCEVAISIIGAWGRATISNCFCMENEVKT